MESVGEVKDATNSLRISDEYQSQQRPRIDVKGTTEEVENEGRSIS